MTTPAEPQPKRPSRNGQKPKKTATLLAQRIVDEITSGRLQPGTTLQPERAMVEGYAVSRGTLRETLRYLEMQGVITLKTGPGGGPVVAAPESRHLAGNLAMMLQLDGASFQSVLDARTTLEPALASMAAKHISEEQLDELAASVERMREKIDDASHFLTENEIFHSIIAEASGNQVFALVIRSLNWIIDGTRLGVEYTSKQRTAVAGQHARILKHIRAGDPDAAETAMRAHIRAFVRYLEQHYPSLIDAPIRWEDV